MHRNTIITVIVIAIVLVIVGVVSVWLVVPKVAGDCKSSRIMPMCKSTSHEVCQSSAETMTKVYDVMDDCANVYITQYGGNIPKYYLKEHTQRTFSYMKRSVHIVIRKKDGTLFDINTLTYVGLHELGHVLCSKMDGDSHGPEYQLVFGRLLNIAKEKGYYDPDAVLDTEYPSE